MESAGASRLKAPSGGGGGSWPGGAYNLVFNFGSPRPKEEVLKDFEPRPSVYHDRIFVIMVHRARQRGANCPLCPAPMFEPSPPEAYKRTSEAAWARALTR